MKTGAWIFLGFLAVLLLAARAHTFREPLERDIATYAVIGHEMNLGRSLYSDLWDNKPPAIYAVCALGERLAGYEPAEIFLINMVAVLAALLGCYAAGSAIGSLLGGSAAALLWMLLSGDLFLQGNQPNAELFINACLAGFLAVRLQPALIRSRSCRLFIAGALAGLATLFKYTAVIPVVFIGIAELAVPGDVDSSKPREMAREWLFILGTVAAMWGMTCGYLAFHHQLQAFVDLVFRFNFHYAQSGGGELAGMSLGMRILSTVSILLRDPKLRLLTVPLLLICLVGAIAGFRGPHRRAWIVWTAFAGGTLLEIAVPGHFYVHYYQLLLPVWAVGAAWTFTEAQNPFFRKVAWVGGVIGCVFCLWREVPFYRLSPKEWSRLKYEDRFVETREISAEIARLLEPGETFYNWGNDPEFYFYTGQRPPTGIFLQYPLVREPHLEISNARVIRDLEQARPDLIVVSKYMIQPERPKLPIVAWIRANYVEFPDGGDRGAFTFLARREGALLRRLKTPKA